MFSEFLSSFLVLPIIGGIIFISASIGYGIGYKEGAEHEHCGPQPPF